MSAADKKDRTINLEKENNTLKEKENLLNREIVSMQTKLRRIESLIGQRNRYGELDGETRGVYDMQDDLQNEIDDLKT